VKRAGRDSNPRRSGSKNVEDVGSDASLRLVACEGLKEAAMDCPGDGPTALIWRELSACVGVLVGGSAGGSGPVVVRSAWTQDLEARGISSIHSPAV
jgi:hypothetical protein